MPPTDQVGLRRTLAVLTAVVLLVVIVLALVVRSSGSTAEPADLIEDEEVCDATEYEGCPARWEYLWADGTTE